MPKATTQLVSLLLMVVWSMAASAVRYQASMHQAEWRMQASPFECRLWQPVPDFGDAVFTRQAGQEAAFYLAPTSPRMQAGKASLVSRPPLWDESRSSLDLGQVEVSQSVRPVSLGQQYAYQLLGALYEGMSPEFTRSSRYQPEQTIQLALSSINFRKAYSQYQQCLTQLLPVNFAQIQRSRIQFKTAGDELTPASLARLEQVVQYVKADPSVASFFIDGHTDNVGRRLYNLELSKKRAEIVTRFLVANGVDEAKITTRYHGERYPVANNNTAQNRAENRRVTIRLERETL